MRKQNLQSLRHLDLNSPSSSPTVSCKHRGSLGNLGRTGSIQCLHLCKWKPASKPHKKTTKINFPDLFKERRGQNLSVSLTRKTNKQTSGAQFQVDLTRRWTGEFLIANLPLPAHGKYQSIRQGSSAEFLMHF